MDRGRALGVVAANTTENGRKKAAQPWTEPAEECGGQVNAETRVAPQRSGDHASAAGDQQAGEHRNRADQNQQTARARRRVNSMVGHPWARA